MIKKFSKLQRIDNNRMITEDADNVFLYYLKNSLLLALKEQGILNMSQYRHAAEKLKFQQFRTTHHNQESQ